MSGDRGGQAQLQESQTQCGHTTHVAKLLAKISLNCDHLNTIT